MLLNILAQNQLLSPLVHYFIYIFNTPLIIPISIQNSVILSSFSSIDRDYSLFFIFMIFLQTSVYF